MPRNRLSAVLALSMLAFAGTQGAQAEEAAPPGFAKKPSVAKSGGGCTIAFAADRATDVAVWIEDAKGQIVRHLAAGALGDKAPAPLKAGALEQSLTWDGKDDDGQPARSGPFLARVALGLKASWGGTAFDDNSGPNHITGVESMAVGPDGRLYVMDNRAGWLYWPAHALHVFRRDGAYERTIKPFAPALGFERAKATGAFLDEAGTIVPLIYRTQGMTFYAFEDEPGAQMAFADGKLFLTVVPSQAPKENNPAYRGWAPHLAALETDGGLAFESYAGPALGNYLWGQNYLAASGDGAALYLTGFGKGAQWDKVAQSVHAVFRVPANTRGPAEVFFGDPKAEGADGTHLNNPRGLAIDGKGHLLVADYGNNRVLALKEADASVAGAFAVPAPEWIGADPNTSAVYVISAGALLKFSAWKEGKEVARLPLPPQRNKDPRGRWTGALDAAAKPPVVWLGSNWTHPALLRVEDNGAAFGALAPAGNYASPRQWRPTADPTKRLVGCMTGGTFDVIDETSGETKRVKGAWGEGVTHRLGPDGCFYIQHHNQGVHRFDPDGRLKPFEATANLPDKVVAGALPDRAGSTGTTAWERDFYVDRKNDLYVKVRGTAYHGLMHVDVFGQDGSLKRTVIHGVTDGSYGPRVDAAGNLYMMECIKPVGQSFPELFVPHATDRMLKHWYDWIYGSIVKFGPQGGNLVLKTRDPAKDRPRADPVKLPDSAPREKVYATFRGDENTVQGALWMHPGVAHCGDMGVTGGGEHCHCTGCDFDIDGFARIFAPDNGRQRVTVLDSNGNVVLNFGAYGNQDYCGPDSYVFDLKENCYRPRKDDDPKDLASPFASPEIAFAWIVGLAVTDRHAYVCDSLNRRMLRVKLGYRTEESVPVP